MQPIQSDRDEPANCGPGRQAAGCCEGVEAVVHELLRRDIAPDVAALLSFGHEVSDHSAELLLSSRDLLFSMHECR